jgi:hypothetical protein
MPTLDGNPIESDSGRQMWLDYASRCCVVPNSGAAELPAVEALNQNAVYESFRRWSRNVRLVDRLQLYAYEVGKDQKSILYFEPREQGAGNAFSGIADAIVTEPEAGQVSNEWLMLPFFRPYSPHDTNIFGFPNFADYYDLFEAGQWMIEDLTIYQMLLWQLSYGAYVSGYGNLLAEGLSGYNYALYDVTAFEHINDDNSDANRVNFYKSRQVYRKPYEIEYCRAASVDGRNVVEIKLDRRLQNTVGEAGGAPTLVARDVSGWDGPTIASEPYRTDENAVRLYLNWVATGYNPPATYGDQGLGSEVHSLYDSVFAAIIPTFLFVKLIPFPARGAAIYHDPMAQLESYIRAMCEGFVDKESSIDLGCNVSDPDGIEDSGDETCAEYGNDLYDFTFENLMLQASDGELSGFLTLPTEATERTSENDCVADPYPSFGPMPATLITAEVFNLFSAALDLLDTARVMLPEGYVIEGRKLTYESTPNEIAPTTECGGPVDCSVGLAYQVSYGQAPRADTLVDDTGWDPALGAVVDAHTGAGYAIAGCGTIPAYSLSSHRTSWSWRYVLNNTDVLYAIPEDWRDEFNHGGGIGGMWCKTYVQHVLKLGGSDPIECDADPLHNFGCNGYLDTTGSTGPECVFLTSGTLDYGPNPPASWYATRWTVRYSCSLGSSMHGTLTPISVGGLPVGTLTITVPVEDTEE